MTNRAAPHRVPTSSVRVHGELAAAVENYRSAVRSRMFGTAAQIADQLVQMIEQSDTGAANEWRARAKACRQMQTERDAALQARRATA